MHFRKTITFPFIVFILTSGVTGCFSPNSIQETSEVATTDSQAADNSIDTSPNSNSHSGQVFGGPKPGATISVRDKEGKVVARTQVSDKFIYTVELPADSLYPLIFSVDSSNDFMGQNQYDLQSIAFGASDKIVNLSPFSTLAMNIALHLPGGLSKENFSAAIDIAINNTGFGVDNGTSLDPIHSQIDNSNIVNVITASELFLETLRRAVANFSPPPTLSAAIEMLAGDLAKPNYSLVTLEEKTEILLPILFKTFTAQVIHEFVNQTLITSGSSIIDSINKYLQVTGASNLTNSDFILTNAFVEQLRKSLATAYVSSNDHLLATIAGLLPTNTNNITEEQLRVALSLLDTNTIDDIANGMNNGYPESTEALLATLNSATFPYDVLANSTTPIAPIDTNPVLAYLQDNNSPSIIAIEAENFSNSSTSSSHQWIETKPLEFPGHVFMQATPDNGTIIDSNFESSSPRLDYTVYFLQSGVHYVWVRGFANDAASDSLHIGIDGTGSSSSDRITNFNQNPAWSQDTMDIGIATITIKEPGLHTINIWMREDGFYLDKIVISSSDTYAPSSFGMAGIGPNESIRTEILPGNNGGPASFPPKAVDDIVTITASEPIEINVLKNDINNTNTTPSLALFSNPNYGTAEVINETSLLYTPDNTFNSTDTFSYKLSDIDGNISTASVTINLICSSCGNSIVIRLSWLPNPDEVAGYKIYFGPTEHETDILVNDTPMTEVLLGVVTDLNLSPGDHACFRIKAYNLNEDSLFSPPVCTTI